MNDKRTSKPFLVRAESHDEIISLVNFLQYRLGYTFNGHKGDFGCPWIYVNIDNRTYMYGIPGISITEPIVDKWIKEQDFRVILDIICKSQNIHNNKDYNKKFTVRKENWPTEQMPIEQETIILNRFFSNEDIINLSYGHFPQQMEDKWFFYVEDNKLYAHRSWTGYCIFILELSKEKKSHEVIINRNSKQYLSTSSQNDIDMINNLLNYWIKDYYDFYTEWLDETLTNIKKNNLVNKYIELRDQHNDEFWLSTGGDGNHELRKEKRNKYEVPLLEKMTEEELHEVIKQTTDFGEKMWIPKRFILKEDKEIKTITIEPKININHEEFYCPVYQGNILNYDCSELCNGSPVLNDGLPSLMDLYEIRKRSHFCKNCSHNPYPDNYDPLWNGDDIMKDDEEPQLIIEDDIVEKEELELIVPSTDDLYLFDVNISGTSYIKNIKKSILNLTIDDVLYLVCEPLNNYDKMAIKVVTIKNEKLGYIPRNKNYVLTKLINVGKTLYLKVKNIENNEYVKINTKLFLKESK